MSEAIAAWLEYFILLMIAFKEQFFEIIYHYPKLSGYNKLLSLKLAETLVVLSINKNDEFPSTLNLFIRCLVLIDNPYFILSKINELSLCRRFPYEVLRLLNKIIKKQKIISNDINKFFKLIELANPDF